jgi:hypothetical protein
MEAAGCQKGPGSADALLVIHLAQGYRRQPFTHQSLSNWMNILFITQIGGSGHKCVGAQKCSLLESLANLGPGTAAWHRLPTMKPCQLHTDPRQIGGFKEGSPVRNERR